MRLIYLTLATALCLLIAPRSFAQSCGCEVSDRKEAAYDELLNPIHILDVEAVGDRRTAP